MDSQQIFPWTPWGFSQWPLKSTLSQFNLHWDDGIKTILWGRLKNKNIQCDKDIFLSGQQIQEGLIASYFALTLFQNGNKKFSFSLGDSPDVVFRNIENNERMIFEIANPDCNNIKECTLTLHKKFLKSYWDNVWLILFHNTNRIDGSHDINISKIKRCMENNPRNPFNQIFIWSSIIWGSVQFIKIFTINDWWHEDLYKPIEFTPERMY